MSSATHDAAHDTPQMPRSLRERLAMWVGELEHVLPAQAPIRNFVHHNTLHGLQHLPFPEALAEARQLTGANPWLGEQRCREYLAAGRIMREDLLAALALADVVTPDELAAPLADFAGLARRDALLAAFERDLAPVSEARCAWLVGEGGALAAPGAAALWQACGEVLGLIEATVAKNEFDVLFADVASVVDEDEDDQRWMFEARALWSVLVGRLGREWTLSTLLARLTGEDVLEQVRPTLIRHLAAHLDLGIAAWRNPQRGRGFYAAWRASAGVDFGWELDEWLAAREEIARLPEDPLETIERELMHLGPDESHWGDYLRRLALELPGWSGMFLWHDRHGRGTAEAPVAMVDYLAVRLVLERVCCEELVHRIWGLPLFLSELGDHFLFHPAELRVRHDFFAGVLGEAEAHEARRLLAGDPGTAGWEALARRIASGPGKIAARARQRWPLFALCRALGIDGEQLAVAGRAGADALLDAACLDAGQRAWVWLLAYERNYREQVFAALVANHGRGEAPAMPAAQLVFCMDDREEGTRRHLEEVNPALETFGAAGFFGVPMYWLGVDDSAPTALCPVVVTPGNEVREVAAPGDEVALQAHRQRRALRLEWQERLHRATRDGTLSAPLLTALAAPFAAAAFLLQALSPAALGNLLRRRRESFEPLPATRAAVAADEFPAAAATVAASTASAVNAADVRAGFSDDEQAERVAGFLKSIGLVSRFAPLVVIVGHGSNSVNNPHAAAYDCGACSGRHGGPNARVFAAMANRPQVRARLAAHGIALPERTWFLGGEHNTADESFSWYDTDLLPAERQADFAALRRDLTEASRRHAVERCRRFASAPFAKAPPTPARALRHLFSRRADWAEARPELGHATVAVGFIGRRAMSRGTFFDRRSFLISYDPTGDADGKILESILLAAGPVGAGIALEYYFSTVDNRGFGCGSKITHNLSGLLGVMEGTASDLRTGLPQQMIEIHEPMRLLLVLEQTPEVIAAIYARQAPLQELIGNGWVVVGSKSPDSAAIHLFDPARGWQAWQGSPDAVPHARDSASWLGAHREPLPPALLGEVAA